MLPLILNSLLATAAADAALACPPQSLEVMVFNIEYGGDLIDFRKVVEAIRAGGAPVVAIEEAWAQMPRLANALGWPYYDKRTQLVSRLPLVERRGEHAAYTLVETSPGCAVAIVNVHLPSDPYGPDRVRAGAGWAEVEALERKTRLASILGPLAEIRSVAATGMPVFLAGDFNAPSFRDDGQPWPVSQAVEAAGLRDSYRDVHPDAKALPGFTWWAARPQVKGWNPDPKDAQVRIDFLYSTASAKATTSRIIGERGSPGVAIGIEPWPSDHRAVVSKFDVTGAPLPALVAVPHDAVTAGDELVVQFHAAGGRRQRRAAARGWRAQGVVAWIAHGLCEAGPRYASLPHRRCRPWPLRSDARECRGRRDLPHSVLDRAARREAADRDGSRLLQGRRRDHRGVATCARKSLGLGRGVSGGDRSEGRRSWGLAPHQGNRRRHCGPGRERRRRRLAADPGQVRRPPAPRRRLREPGRSFLRGASMSDQRQAIVKLAAQQWRLALRLTAAMMAVYFGFILLVAWAKPLLGRLLVPGLSLGTLLGALVIVFAWLVIWIYVSWANNHYDQTVASLRERR